MSFDPNEPESEYEEPVYCETCIGTGIIFIGDSLNYSLCPNCHGVGKFDLIRKVA